MTMRKIFLLVIVPLLSLNAILWSVYLIPYPGKAIARQPMFSKTAGCWIDRGTILSIEEWVDIPYYEEDGVRKKFNVLVSRELPYAQLPGELFRRATIWDMLIARRPKIPEMLPEPDLSEPEPDLKPDWDQNNIVHI